MADDKRRCPIPRPDGRRCGLPAGHSGAHGPASVASAIGLRPTGSTGVPLTPQSYARGLGLAVVVSLLSGVAFGLYLPWGWVVGFALGVVGGCEATNLRSPRAYAAVTAGLFAIEIVGGFVVLTVLGLSVPA